MRIDSSGFQDVVLEGWLDGLRGRPPPTHGAAGGWQGCKLDDHVYTCLLSPGRKINCGMRHRPYRCTCLSLCWTSSTGASWQGAVVRVYHWLVALFRRGPGRARNSGKNRYCIFRKHRAPLRLTLSIRFFLFYFLVFLGRGKRSGARRPLERVGLARKRLAIRENTKSDQTLGGLHRCDGE